MAKMNGNGAVSVLRYPDADLGVKPGEFENVVGAAEPVTDRQNASASWDELTTAARMRNCSATAADTSTLIIAVSQAASPSWGRMPRAVSRASSSGADHATTTA